MDSKSEQRVVIKFLIDSGEKLAKIFLKLKKVFCNECVLRASVFNGLVGLKQVDLFTTTSDQARLSW